MIDLIHDMAAEAEKLIDVVESWEAVSVDAVTNASAFRGVREQQAIFVIHVAETGNYPEVFEATYTHSNVVLRLSRDTAKRAFAKATAKSSS